MKQCCKGGYKSVDYIDVERSIMAETTTIRVTQQTHQILKDLAEQAGEPLTAVLDKAIEAYRRNRLLEETNAAYAALRKDPKKWAEELQERQAWEATLPDGLEDY
jgi:hypothetical protein